MIFFYLAKYVRKWLKKQKKSLCSIFFIKKRLYLLLISLNFYLITNFKCFGGFKWPLNVRRKR